MEGYSGAEPSVDPARTAGSPDGERVRGQATGAATSNP